MHGKIRLSSMIYSHTERIRMNYFLPRNKAVYYLFIILAASVHSTYALQRKMIQKIGHTTVQPKRTYLKRNFSIETLMPLVPYLPLISSLLSSVLIASIPDFKKKSSR